MQLPTYARMGNVYETCLQVQAQAFKVVAALACCLTHQPLKQLLIRCSVCRCNGNRIEDPQNTIGRAHH